MPRGPDREKIKYKNKPTTTGGRPIIALRKVITSFLPLKLLIARIVPKGIANMPAIASELKLTFIESRRISIRSESAEIINVSASSNAFISIIMHFLQTKN